MWAWHEPDNAAIVDIAEQALQSIPAGLRRAIGNVAVLVEEFADPQTLAEMAIDNPYHLLGLYSGVSLDRKSQLDTGATPDMIHLYRRPMLAYARTTGEPFPAVVRHVLIHEIGHHFGFSDVDMAAIEEADSE